MGQTIKILLKEPEEIKNPYLKPDPTAEVVWVAVVKNGFDQGKQAVLDAMIDVDDARFDELIIGWLLTKVAEIGEVASGKVIVKGKRPSEYLKEQLGVK